jgi:hypothetical protein
MQAHEELQGLGLKRMKVAMYLVLNQNLRQFRLLDTHYMNSKLGYFVKLPHNSASDATALMRVS